MQRLADLAGVSRATVSRALNDSELVNEATRERIQALAREQGYVLNEAARNFRLGRSHIVGVVLMLDLASKQHVYDPFFLEMIGNIADALGERGYNTLLSHAPLGTADAMVRSRLYQQSDGLVIVGQGNRHREINRLAAEPLPLVVWGASLPGRRYTVVGSDNRQGGFLATQHLIEQGCRHIAFFGDKSLPEIGERHAGYCEALQASGMAPEASLERAVPFDAARASAVIDAFLAPRPALDGIVCSSDLIAMTAVSSLGKAGLRVPADVAVVGYDDIGLAERAAPPLTTISQDIRGGGRRLVECLVALIHGETVRDAIAPARLVVRESSVRRDV